MTITHADTTATIDGTKWNHAHTVAFVGCKAYATATQSVASSTEVPITFDSEEFDSHGFHEGVTQPTRFTIPSGWAGKYRLNAGGFANSGGSPQIFLKVNGTTNVRGSAEGVNDVNKTCNAVVDLAVGDYVQVIAYQTSGGPLTWGHASELQSQWTLVVQWLGT